MRILSASGGIAYTNCFLVVDDDTSKCVLIDAPDHTVAPLLNTIDEEKLDLIGLWLTHGHFDHLADHQVVRDRFPGVPVLIHPLDEPKLVDPRSRIFPLPFTIPPGKADALLADGQVLNIGTLSARVIHTPGHSPGHVAFYFETEQVLIGGDLIIGGAVGRTDLPDSDHAALEASVRNIMRLPGGVRLLPGHGQPSRLDDERRTNAYVRMILEQQG
jgi:hydroxyacylglutathione hydrolase